MNVLQKAKYDLKTLLYDINQQKNDLIHQFSNLQKRNELFVISNGSNYAVLTMKNWTVNYLSGCINLDLSDQELFSIGTGVGAGYNFLETEKTKKPSGPSLYPYISINGYIEAGIISGGTSTMSYDTKEKLFSSAPSEFLINNSSKPGFIVTLGNYHTRHAFLGIKDHLPITGLVCNEDKEQIIFCELNNGFKLFSNYLGLVIATIHNNKQNFFRLGVNIAHFLQQVESDKLIIYNIFVGLSNLSQMMYAIMFGIPLDALGMQIIIEIRYANEFEISLRITMEAAMHYNLYL